MDGGWRYSESALKLAAYRLAKAAQAKLENSQFTDTTELASTTPLKTRDLAKVEELLDSLLDTPVASVKEEECGSDEGTAAPTADAKAKSDEKMLASLLALLEKN